jgi:hypothetical protein
MLDVIPLATMNFLSAGWVDYERDVGDKPLSEFSEAEKKALASKSSVEGPDPGPYNA